MRTKSSLDFRTEQAHVVALGCFDGVHVGHTELIRQARRIADEASLPLAVFSFAQPPKSFFSKGPMRLLTSRDEKKRIMASLGADLFVCVPFDGSIANITAEQFFLDVLKNRLNASHVICGFNYRFGKNGLGNADLLRDLCKKSEIGISVVSPVEINGAPVSSSAIRRALEDGNVRSANLLLGRPYSISSTVVSGQQLGRTLGFPTVNQIFDQGLMPPKNGVYLSRVRIGHAVKKAITNVGVRPTVDGQTLCAETNIFDFEGDLYGKKIRVEFLEFIRPEQKFDSLEQLSAQVHRDIEKAKNT